MWVWAWHWGPEERVGIQNIVRFFLFFCCIYVKFSPLFVMCMISTSFNNKPEPVLNQNYTACIILNKQFIPKKNWTNKENISQQLTFRIDCYLKPPSHLNLIIPTTVWQYSTNIGS